MPALPDQKQLLAHFKQCDPKIVAVIRAVGPLKLKPNKPYYVVLARAIVSQQISVKAAETIYGRFAGLFAGCRPQPKNTRELSDEKMKQAGLSRQKISYLKDLARHFEQGLIKTRRFNSMDNEAIIEQLVQVKGIGRWTAEMFLIFSLNRLDVLPIDDLGLKAWMQKNYQLKPKPDAKELKAIGARWHPYQSIATWYIWALADG